MIPINFPEVNRTLNAPKGMTNCLPLPVFTDGASCVSLWELTKEEVVELVATRKLWLCVCAGGTQPPVLPSVVRLLNGEGESTKLRDGFFQGLEPDKALAMAQDSFVAWIKLVDSLIADADKSFSEFIEQGKPDGDVQKAGEAFVKGEQSLRQARIEIRNGLKQGV